MNSACKGPEVAENHACKALKRSQRQEWQSHAVPYGPQEREPKDSK